MSRLRVGSQTWTQRETHTQGATMATVGSIHAVIANMGTMKKTNICDQCVDASHYCHGCHLYVNVSRCVHVCRLGVDISHYSHDCRLCVDISLCVHVYHPCMDISNDSHYWHLCYFWSHLGPSWNPFGGLKENGKTLDWESDARGERVRREGDRKEKASEGGSMAKGRNPTLYLTKCDI